MVSVVVNVTFVPDDEGTVVLAKVVVTLLLEISVVGSFAVVVGTLLLESVVGASVVIKLQEGRICVVVVVNGSVKVNLL